MKLSINPLSCIRGQRVAAFKLELESCSLIFNVPDSFQRFLSENGIRNDSNLKVLFTRNSGESFLGFLGYFMTLIAQNKNEGLKIYMPAPLLNFVYRNRYLYGARCSMASFGGIDDFAVGLPILDAQLGDSSGSPPLLGKMDMLGGFNSQESLSKLDDFNFLDYMENWRGFFTPEVLGLFESSEMNLPFSAIEEPGLLAPDIEEKFNLIRLQHDNVSIYVRSNQSLRQSKGRAV